jgi:hypothetical protein
MFQEISRMIDHDVCNDVSVFTSEGNPYGRPTSQFTKGHVFQGYPYDNEAPIRYTPAQARELAAALLRAADEAEGVEPRITLKDVPEDLLQGDTKEHMRTHVYVNVSATEWNPDGRRYRRAGYRKCVERDAWFSASDAQRTAALVEAGNYVAQSSRHQAEVEGQWPPPSV